VIYLPELSVASLEFPPVSQALTEPDGLLAMGGDLSVRRLLKAYQNGIFPWFNPGDPLLWWSPSQRAIFKPGVLKANRSLRKQLHQQQFQLTVNQAFAEVIKACSAPRPSQQGTWIVPAIQQAYLRLHQAGHAHSIEVWSNGQLVGGCYGVMVGQLFCGESMFNRQPNTAKIALIALQQHLSRIATGYIDCQMMNPFLQQLGAEVLSRSDYLALLVSQQQQSCPAGSWLPQPMSLEL
jgi:leucyl/phenylalanyl-tRNA--protein transferase